MVIVRPGWIALILATAPVGSSRASTEELGLITANGRIGTLKVTTESRTVDVDWRVDVNGRGPKIREHIVLGKNGLPISRQIEGNSEFGAPIKETFTVEAGHARWTTLGDAGDAEAGERLYLASGDTPWSLMHQLKILRASKDQSRPALPTGRVRLQKLRQIAIGAANDPVEAYALWGLGLGPELLLARGDTLVARLSTDRVLTREKYLDRFAELSRIASELTAQLLGEVATRLTHRWDEPVWITNVRVFDPEAGTASAGRNVVVHGRRIVGVRSDSPPPGAVTIDGGGGTLLPGLHDAHTHLDEVRGLLHVAAGVTQVRDMGSENTSLLAMIRRFDSGELIGPRVLANGFLEGKSPYSNIKGFIVQTEEEAVEKVRWYADHGFWGIKIYNSMPPGLVKPIAKEAHRLGLHVSGHVPAFMTSEQALRDGYDEISHINQLLLMFVLRDKEDPRTLARFTSLGEHLADLDLQGAPLRQLIALMRERKASLDPTISIFGRSLLAQPGKTPPPDVPWLEHVPVAVRRDRQSGRLDIKPELRARYQASWKKLGQVLNLLHRDGIPLALGTDDVPGLTLHSELETWVSAGISPAAALKAATLGNARLLGREGETGTVAVGKLADLYLVEGDPLTNIGDIRRGRLVVKDGALFFPDEIHAALEITPFARHVEPRTAGLEKPASR